MHGLSTFTGQTFHAFKRTLLFFIERFDDVNLNQLLNSSVNLISIDSKEILITGEQSKLLPQTQ